MTNGTKKEIESLISQGVLEGKSARVLSKELKGYVKGKPIRYAGTLIKGANLNYQAIRLAATEMNMAFRTADYLQNSRLPFVTGVTVELSAAHPISDICDELQGHYPKGFNFTGWHPLCYSSDTEVYTNDGWKLFKDLLGNENILSLNPDTKDLEWTPIVKTMKYWYNGKMIRFYSRSLDMMVTPDHKMVGFDKTNGKLRSSSAEQFYEKLYPVKIRNVFSTSNRLYRTSEWIGEDSLYITIGQYGIQTDLYCEFMGYYLSEGSTSRKYAVTISQNKAKNPNNYEKISQCLRKMPFKVTKFKAGFNIYDKSLWEHVKPFGKSFEKYVPYEIKKLPKEKIEIFLDAYCLGDGTIRISKAWKGGNFNNERTFSTSSVKMADDIGECILKIGHHPSFYTDQTKGRISKHWNGDFVSNNDQIIVRDCRSQYVTQLNREKIPYSDMVYDIEVEKNHIIYVRRNGKCVWGSNCICFATYDTIPKEEFVKYIETGDLDQRRFTRAIPQRAQRYLEKNGERLLGYKNTPYWLRDNFTDKLVLRDVVQTPIMAKPVEMVQEMTRGHILEMAENENIDDIIKHAELKGISLDKKQAKFMRESIRRWGGGEYQSIREYQQTGKMLWKFEKDIPKVSNAVEQYIDIMPKYNGDIVYRNINIGYNSQEYKLFSKLPSGSVINMEGTNSWTSSKHLYSTSRNVQFVLEKPKSGVSIQHLTDKIKEEEVLFSKKSEFVVTKIEEIQAGTIKEIKQVAVEDDTFAQIFGSIPEPEIITNEFDKLVIYVKEVKNVK